MNREPKCNNIVQVTGDGAGIEFKGSYGFVIAVDAHECVVHFPEGTKGTLSDNKRIYALEDVTVVCNPITGEPI